MFRKLFLALAVLLGLASTGKTQASLADTLISAPVPGLVSVHCPKSKYSQAAAIAHAQSKYPGYSFQSVRELTNVWVVILKN